MSRLVKALFLFCLISASIFAYTKVMARMSSGAPPAMLTADQRADRVIVHKNDRRLELWRGEVLLKSYEISLGPTPTGHKQREGDGKTPEGTYVIDWRNPNSIAHLSLHISYPDDKDRARAARAGVPPGGNIMIHGILNGWGWLGQFHLLWDWTNGCIAVSDSEMREIWARVPNGAPITILR